MFLKKLHQVEDIQLIAAGMRREKKQRQKEILDRSKRKLSSVGSFGSLIEKANSLEKSAVALGMNSNAMAKSAFGAIAKEASSQGQSAVSASNAFAKSALNSIAKKSPSNKSGGMRVDEEEDDEETKGVVDFLAPSNNVASQPDNEGRSPGKPKPDVFDKPEQPDVPVSEAPPAPTAEAANEFELNIDYKLKFQVSVRIRKHDFGIVFNKFQVNFHGFHQNFVIFL